MNDKDKVKALAASTRNSAWGKKVVGRLLTPLELDEVAGGHAGCNGNGNHSMSSGSNFTQSGGSFNQNGGGTYNMNCTSSDPIRE